MKSILRISPRAIAVFFTAMMAVVILTEVSEAGSFGSSRSRGGSSGSSRSRSSGGSFGSSRSRSGGGWFGSKNNGSSSSTPQTQPYSSQRSGSSFGSSRSGSSLFGRRMNSQQEYTAKYGTPRRQETQSWAGNDGVQRNVIVNSYGGYSDGLMTGYLMGRSSWFWYTPFHPAFYYSRPVYYERPDGMMEYYPPTFSYGTLFFVLLIVGVGVFIIYVVVRNKRRKSYAFGDDYSQSSFS